MTLYFITGNKHKFEEFDEILSPRVKVYQLEAELDEIQSTSPQEVIRHKLIEAMKYHTGEFLVEDTSLYLEALKWKLPGPFVKWFLSTIGREGIFNITQKLGQFGAEAKTIVGYSNGKEIKFFEGSVKGKIIQPKAQSDFGWDPLFVPEGHTKSFAQMSKKEKNSLSMRRKALEKFRDEYLKKKQEV